MNNLIASSKILWKNLIRNLLLLSPNISISRCVETASASQLRYLVVQYSRIAAVLHTSIQLNRASDIRSFPYHEAIFDVKVVPGMPFLVIASTSFLHLVSARTGAFMSSWPLPEGGISDNTRVSVSSSGSHGVGPLVIINSWPKPRAW
jgi:hypothetical protein